MPCLTRRTLAAGLAAAGFAPMPGARAQGAGAWPEKTIRMIVPFPPGGGSDFLGRLLAQKLSEGLGQAMIVDNKPGASGSIGADAAAKAAPDGYTLLMVVRDMGINPSIFTSLPYDTLKSFAWIAKVAEGPYVLVVNPAVQATTVAELVALAKAKPGAISYGSLGIGSMGHVNVEAFIRHFGINMLHVPYKGAGPALAATVSGEVSVSLAALTGAMPMVREGRLRALVVGAEKRVSLLPDVPSIVEAGAPVETLLPTHWGFAAPVGTPKPIIDRLNAELKRALALPEIAEKIAQNGLIPVHSTPEALAALVESDIAHFARLVKAIGIEPQ